MNEIILTACPANTTKTVKEAQLIDVCPREEEFGWLLKSISSDLIQLINGNLEYETVLITGSGTASMDAVINSVVPKKTELLVIENGAYGKRFQDIAISYGINCVCLRTEWGGILDLSKLTEILNLCPKISTVAVVHHETTTGIVNSIYEIGRIVKQFNKTYIIDTISSLGAIPIDIQKTKADFILGSSNKGIQGMTGLSFVIGKTNEFEKIKNYEKRSYYLNLRLNRDHFRASQQTPFTPAVQSAYALRTALDELADEGIENRYNRYSMSWETLVDGMIELGFKILLPLEFHSRLVTTFYEPKGFDFKIFHDKLKDNGYIIYPGKLTDKKTFRIGNMGNINKKHIKQFLKIVRKIV